MNILWFNLKVDQNDQVLAFNLDWINKMAKKVNKIVVITMENGQYNLEDNVVVFSVGKEKGYSEFRRFFVFYKLLFKVLRQEKIDVVFAHMNTVFSFLSIPFLKLKKIPLVSWYSHFVMNFISKVSLKFSNSIFTASDEIYNSFKNKCVLTGHGINLSIFPPNKNLITETKKKSIVTVGRISPVKEYETLIEAIRILRVEEHKNIFLKIIGLPPDRDIEYHRKLKEKVDKLNLTNFIMFIGGIPYKELPKFLSEGDLFINMQCQGGVGKAVLEAMATGVPVMVCTKIFNIDFGEVKELLVFEKGNSKDLAQKVINFFMLSRQKRRDLSDLMIALSKKHSLDNLINRIFESLEEHRIKFIRNN